ncbi:MAG: ElaA protein [Limisphaerales bacterium]|jgi:ElaA protein
MNIQFELKPWSKVSRDEVEKAFRLRADIFIVEQDCVYPDIDGKDHLAWHSFAWDNDHLASYLRIFPPGPYYDDAAAIGRIVTDANYRGQKLAGKLIQQSIKFIKSNIDTGCIKMSAQTHLKNYYGSFGFTPEGDEYDEDGIMHVCMVMNYG